ncbi:cGMP-dependent protein kinase [Aureococcus anophagefferens]|nr:cGMP-dependent protein kinase [Aureococcus anophagefferens]
MGSAVSGQRKNHKSTGDLRADAPPAAAVHGSSTAPAASRSLSGVVVEDSPTARGDRRKERAARRVLCSPTLPRKSGEWSDDSPVRRASRTGARRAAPRDRARRAAGKRSVESRIDRFELKGRQFARDGSVLWTPQTTHRSLKPDGAAPSRSNAMRAGGAPRLSEVPDSPSGSHSSAGSQASSAGHRPRSPIHWGSPARSPTTALPVVPTKGGRKISMQSLQDIHDLLKPLEDEDHPGRHTVAANPSPPSLRRGNTHAAFERTPSPHAAPRRLSRSNTAQGIADEAATTAKRRRNMYWKATATGDDARLLGDDGAVREVPAATFSLISGALTDMFFLGSTMFSQMHAVVAAFELETFEEGDVLLREGDKGDKLYVLEAGVVRVSRSRVFHEQQRSRPSTPTGRGAFSFEDTDDFDDDPDSPEVCLGRCGPGDVVGELALLYSEQRTATATVEAGYGACRAWSLTRDRFRALAAIADTRSLSERAIALRKIPTLNGLGRRQIYLLAKAMKNRKYHPGAELFAPGREVDTCFLVEDGELLVSRGGGGGAAATIDELFPDGVDTQDVSVDGDVVLCRPGTLLGVRPRCAARDDCDAVFTLGDFAVEYLLGEGTYGSVLRARLRDGAGEAKADAVAKADNGVVAIKQMSKRRIVDKKQVAHVRDERELLSTVRHGNILGLYGAFQDRDHVYLITELVEGPDLWSVLYDPDEAGFEDHSPLCDASDALLRHYCACVAECLFHLHARGIVYRDLKPENLMVARNGYLKLVDFGFAKRLPYYRTDADEAELTAHFKTYTMCGTAEYISPEIINGSGHDWSADVWAAGCLFHELLVGSTPFVEFPGETTDQALIFKRAVTSQYKPFMPPFALVKRKHAAALVNAMLKFDPSERFAASAVLAHGYFAPTDWPRLRTQDDEPEWTPPPRGAGFYKDKLCARPAEPYDDAKGPRRLRRLPLM